MLKTLSPHPSLLPRLNVILTSLSSLPNQHRKMDNGCYAYTFPLVLLPQWENSSHSSPDGLFSWRTDFHGLPQGESFPWLAAPHKLLQHGPLPWMLPFRNELPQPGVATHLCGSWAHC